MRAPKIRNKRRYYVRPAERRLSRMIVREESLA